MTYLTPEAEHAILESVRHGTPIGAAFEAAGISTTTLYRWKRIADGAEQWPDSSATAKVSAETREKVVSFVAALGRARAESVKTLTSALWQNATTVGRNGFTDTQAADKLLSKNPANHQDWWERKQMDVHQTSTVHHEHELVKGATPEELESWERELEALPPGSLEHGDQG